MTASHTVPITILTIAIGLLILSAVAVTEADAVRKREPITVYTNDFSDRFNVDGWSHPTLERAPNNPEKFLGRFGNGPITLKLAELPPHKNVTVSFDLYLINSWDGNDETKDDGTVIGPDIWQFGEVHKPPVLRTSFAKSMTQSYPDEFGFGDHPAFTGVTEVNTLGFNVLPLNHGDVNFGDATYSIERTFAHSKSNLELVFEASNLQWFDDESWGLDNLVITVH